MSFALTKVEDIKKISEIMFESGLFSDLKQAAQAFVKIQAGMELGIGPYASMNAINIIQNKTTLTANVQAAKIKSSGKYRYVIEKLTEEECIIIFYEKLDDKWEEIGKSRFSIKDSERAGLLNKSNWRQYPKNMLFCRAISNGQKMFCPDIFMGQLIYDPDELGAETDENGNVILDKKGNVIFEGEDKIADEKNENLEADDLLRLMTNEIKIDINKEKNLDSLRRKYTEYIKNIKKLFIPEEIINKYKSEILILAKNKSEEINKESSD